MVAGYTKLPPPREGEVGGAGMWCGAYSSLTSFFILRLDRRIQYPTASWLKKISLDYWITRSSRMMTMGVQLSCKTHSDILRNTDYWKRSHENFEQRQKNAGTSQGLHL
jgi:hypothetical protein